MADVPAQGKIQAILMPEGGKIAPRRAAEGKLSKVKQSEQGAKLGG